MSDLYSKIETLCLQRKIRVTEMCKGSGVSRASLTDLKMGRKQGLSAGTIAKIAAYFGKSTDYFLAAEKATPPAAEESRNIIIPMTDISMVPIVGKIAAGVPILAQQNIVGYQPIPLLANADEYFCLRVSGNSMVGAGIEDGSVVLIRKQSCADDGNIVACMVNGGDATLKRFRQSGSIVLLLPENPSYQPILVPVSDFEQGQARIIGVAVQVLSTRSLL